MIYISLFSTSRRGKEWVTFTTEEKDAFLEEVIGPQRKYGKNKIWIPTIFYSTVSTAPSSLFLLKQRMLFLRSRSKNARRNRLENILYKNGFTTYIMILKYMIYFILAN